MGRKDLFKELDIKRRQKIEMEVRQKREKEKTEKARIEMVRKFGGRVGKVVKEFSRSSDYYLEERRANGALGFWSDHPGTPSFVVSITPSSVAVLISSYPFEYFREIPLANFTEEALAKALIEGYKKYMRL